MYAVRIMNKGLTLKYVIAVPNCIVELSGVCGVGDNCSSPTVHITFI